MHGDQDVIVPLLQSSRMMTVLEAAGVQAKLVTIKGGQHARNFGFKSGDSQLLDYFGEIARWFDQHLATNKK